MAKEVKSLIGNQYGRWTVIGDYIETDKGVRKWLCQCSCGTERYVLERSLIYGESVSCGCLRKENTKKALSYDLTGKQFGDLTVLYKSEKQPENGGVWWHCRCACGNETDVPATLLVTKKKTHCGCKGGKGNRPVDITGNRYGRLTALYPTDKRDSKGSVIWHCRCDCGEEIDASYNAIVFGNMRSCGCLKKEHNEKLQTTLKRVAGTSIDLIKCGNVPKNNTTGTRGVYYIRGKYVAKIVFKKKAYYLGTYDNMEDAVRARKYAEKDLYAKVVNYYDLYEKASKINPEWAQDNPVEIKVSRKHDMDFDVSFMPETRYVDYIISSAEEHQSRNILNILRTEIAYV